MKYVYPAIFIQEGTDYNVQVPDLPGCVTFGRNLPDAIQMARDAMSMWLCDAEDNMEIIPVPSSHVVCEDGGFINLIDCDTDAYRRENDNRAVKKTLSIPSWLNAKAERAGVNFSQVLQDGLKQKLNIQ